MGRVHTRKYLLEQSIEANNGSTLLNPYHILFDGDYMYAIYNTSKAIVSFDVSDPSAISTVDILVDATNITNPQRMVMKGNYILIIDFSGITTIDKTDPTALAFVSRFTHTYLAQHNTGVVEGNYLYTSGQSNILTLDITDPTSISYVTRAYTLDFRSGNPSVKGNYLYGMGGNSIYAVNKSNPASLTITRVTDSAKIDGGSRNIISGNTFLSVSILDNWIVPSDISAGTPVIGTPVSLPSGCTGGYFWAGLDSSYCWMTSITDSKIWRLDLSTPTSPVATSVLYDSVYLDYIYYMEEKLGRLFLCSLDRDRIYTIVPY